MMPAVSSKLRIAKDAPAPPKKIEKEDEEIVPVHKKKSVKKHHEKHHKDDGAPKAGALSLKGKSLLKVLSMADFFQRQRHGCQRATQTTHARGPTRAARYRTATQAAARRRRPLRPHLRAQPR
jgi:hypothetical protein